MIITLLIKLFLRLFARGPEAENETMRDMQTHAQETSDTDVTEETDDNEGAKRKSTREEYLMKMKQKAMVEEGKRKPEERAWVLEREAIEREREREREAISSGQTRLAEEEERIAEREQELQEWIVQARERITEEYETAATMGFQPIKWPTGDEFRAAKEKAQYNPQNFHFAIVGTAGCGKSSLINAFLNLKSTDLGAAPTGINETTLDIGRYADPGTQPPRPWTIWYDVPGAGTQRIPHRQYFTNQALFVFDIIILAIGDRFQESDCQIIRSCIEFKIPYFIVRSKSDQTIAGMMEDADEDYEGPFDSGEFYQKCRQLMIEGLRKMVSEELRRAGLPDQVLYCVSKKALREVYNGALNGSVQSDDDSHEMALVKDLMLAAYLRRSTRDYTSIAPSQSIRQPTMRWAKSAYTTAGDIAESTIELGIAGISKLGINISHQKRQENQEQIPSAKRVIYLPHRTTVIELLAELNQHNPGLSITFVAHPRMLGPKVALLCFDSTAPIPSTIQAFGKSHKLAMFKEKASKGRRAPTVVTSNSTSANTPPSSIYTPPGSSFFGTDRGQWGQRR